MKTSELLRAAKALPRTKGAVARDLNGNKTYADSPSAATFCAVGALQKVGFTEAADQCLEQAASDLKSAGEIPKYSYGYVTINDYHPAKMDQVWDRAIELAENAEAASESV